MKNILSTIIALFLFGAVGDGLVCKASAGVPLQYYTAAHGKTKDQLKRALHNTIQPQKVLGYGSGAGRTWSGFYQTDRMDDGEVRDRYSNDHRYFAANASANSASAVSGMNIEHSFPKSWWGGTENNAYKDLFNLMPCEQSINQSKSNYAMGVVTSVTTDNGCTKVGKGTTSPGTTKSLWEPADQWKGDFARAYMYMATTYSDFTWEKEGLTMLEQNEWPTLQPWAYALLVKWNKEDPVDDIEVARNEAVYTIQGNRNPFVDFPHLADYVWGDSVTYAFDIYTTFKAGEAIEGGGTGTGDDGGFNIDEDGAILDIATLKKVCTGSKVDNGAQVVYRFENLLVTYVNGKNIFVHDGREAFLLYGTNSLKMKAGDRISGEISGVAYFYNLLPELSFTDLTDVTIVSSGESVEPQEVSVTDVTGEHHRDFMSCVVRIKDVTMSATAFDNKNLSCSDSEGNVLPLYDTWRRFTDTIFSLTQSYDVVCIPVVFYSTLQAYPISITETVETGINAIPTADPIAAPTMDAATTAPTDLYDLTGRPVRAAYHGIMIDTRGRKVIR